MAGVHVGGVAAERSSFVGSRVPDEISKMINVLNSVSVDKTTFRAIVSGMQNISYNGSYKKPSGTGTGMPEHRSTPQSTSVDDKNGRKYTGK